MKSFNHAQIEEFARQYWSEHNTYRELKDRLKHNKPFMFLDGPPYTSGKVHIGTALNKSLKDMVLRIKRMQGYAVFDRAGYDMHGLPTEQPTMKRLGLHTRADIEAYGVDKFVLACKDWCTSNMAEMNDAFARLGVWMDFENAYQPISKTYISGIWLLIKRAHEKNRLYEGLRTMAWDPVYETACAKHELDYASVTDQSIYVKFPLTAHGKKTNRFLVVWTTTPWTIPFNLAVMVNPEVEYAIVSLRGEEWIIASDRVEALCTGLLEEDFKIISTVRGVELEGLHYEHFFQDRLPYSELKNQHPRVHTVVLSKDYVDTQSGTGLVHCAPGCGPEDYEVGIQYGLPAYNTVGTDGVFSGAFSPLRARTDDAEFTRQIELCGALVAKQAYTHDYPHSERSKAPVIYRATSQWFFRVNDLKDRMLEENEKIFWQPQAAHNAFSSWLANLRDNSITKQRYWGTPVPIWKNDETGEVLVIGSISELETLSGTTVAEPHKPWIDDITIPSKEHPGTTLRRIPDVIDVWVDAGSASWNALDYPENESLIKTHYPADFILEGKDQIRGWFNLLMVAGMLAFDKPSFKAVYMHGYINDSQGRKMSKSLGNYITPDEVLPKYGVDTFRLALIGGGTPGLDIVYSQENIVNAHKNLNVLWNTVQYLVDLCNNNDILPSIATDGDEEEQYVLSRLQSLTKLADECVEQYNLPVLAQIIQDYWLELSRTYIQLTREKSTGEEKSLVANTLYTALRRVVTLLAPVCPFTAEALWQDLNTLTHSRASVHEESWPEYSTEQINTDLEGDFNSVQQLITASLSCRDQLKIGVRWPLEELVITAREHLPQYNNLIARQVNVKRVTWGTISTQRTITPNYGSLGKSFGRDTQRVAKLIEEHKPEPGTTIEGFTILAEHLKVVEHAPEGFVQANLAQGSVYLKTEVTPELLEEGFARELTRRIQSLRKDLGLQKRDAIELHIGGAHMLSANHLADLMRKTNASIVGRHVGEERHEHIRDRTYTISARKIL